MRHGRGRGGHEERAGLARFSCFGRLGWWVEPAAGLRAGVTSEPVAAATSGLVAAAATGGAGWDTVWYVLATGGAPWDAVALPSAIAGASWDTVRYALATAGALWDSRTQLVVHFGMPCDMLSQLLAHFGTPPRDSWCTLGQIQQLVVHLGTKTATFSSQTAPAVALLDSTCTSSCSSETQGAPPVVGHCPRVHHQLLIGTTQCASVVSRVPIRTISRGLCNHPAPHARQRSPLVMFWSENVQPPATWRAATHNPGSSHPRPGGQPPTIRRETTRDRASDLLQPGELASSEPGNEHRESGEPQAAVRCSRKATTRDNPHGHRPSLTCE